jgi:hypothetical protein
MAVEVHRSEYHRSYESLVMQWLAIHGGIIDCSISKHRYTRKTRTKFTIYISASQHTKVLQHVVPATFQCLSKDSSIELGDITGANSVYPF